MFPWREADAPKRICASTCKTTHRLNDADLSMLECVRVRNPHYRSAAPMRLYFEAQVIEAARLKAIYVAGLAAFREAHKADITAWVREVGARRKLASAAAAKDRRDTAKESSVAVLSAYNPHTEVSIAEGRTCGLPDEVLRLIMIKVARSVEVDGIRGPGAVCKDLCNAAMASKELRRAAAAGFEELGRTVATSNQLRDQAIWNKLVRSPMLMTGAQLRALAGDAGIGVSGPKAVLACSVLTWMGLSRRPAEFVPAIVVLAVASETRESDYPARLRGLIRCFNRARGPIQDLLRESEIALTRWRPTGGLRAAREVLQRRCPTIAHLERELGVPARAAVCPAPRPVTVPAQPPRPVPVPSRHDCAECRTQQAAATCVKAMCASCCQNAAGPCARHRVL